MTSREPAEDARRFNCPHCGVLAHQYKTVSVSVLFPPGPGDASPQMKHAANQTRPGNRHFWSATTCSNCEHTALWCHGDMLYPRTVIGEPANPDMPVAIRALYDEARKVGFDSPRSAAALLRVAAEHLVNGLDKGSGDLNTKIGRLEKVGLSPAIVELCHTLRIYGNEGGAHAGTIDLTDDTKMVRALLRLLNAISDQVLTRERTLLELVEEIPESKRPPSLRRNARPATD